MLKEGQFPSDASLYTRALECIDTVYKLISTHYRYSFEGLRYIMDQQKATAVPELQDAPKVMHHTIHADFDTAAANMLLNNYTLYVVHSCCMSLILHQFGDITIFDIID